MNKELEEILATLATPGWALMIEDYSGQLNNLAYKLTTEPFDAYNYGKVQGIIQTLRALLTQKQAIEIALKEQEPVDE